MPTFTPVINARTQSTRTSNKLLRTFAGTTLIDLALSKLDQMDFVEERLLAVAEDIFVEKAAKYGNVKIKRRCPESVKKGHVPMKLRYQQYLDIETDYVLIFNPCHPFIEVDTVREAVEHVKRDCFNSYTSVVESTEWVFDAEGQPITNKDPKIVSTNQGPKRYKVAHAFHFIRPEFFRKKGILWTFERNDPAMIEITDKEALDVDTELEFEILLWLYAKST